MTRVKTPGGKRSPTVGTRLSEAKHAAVMAAVALEGTKPALWLEGLIDKALAEAGISAGPPAEDLPVQVAGRPRRVRKSPAEKSANGRKVVAAAPSGPPSPPPPVSRPAGAGVFQEPGGQPVVTDMPPVPAVQRRRCTHKGTQIIGGYCHECAHIIDSGGLTSLPCATGQCSHGGKA